MADSRHLSAIGSNVIIDQGAWIGDGVTIGASTNIGRYAVICAGAQVGGNVVIGKNVLVQTREVVAGGTGRSAPRGIPRHRPRRTAAVDRRAGARSPHP